LSGFHPFLMERMMSRFEQDVEYNLSESGVHPLSLRELLDDDAGLVEDLLSCRLGYPHVNGLPELRESIASLYAGATAGNVLVTVGAAEANYISTRTLLTAGDEVAIMLPNYMQIWGIARNHGLSIREFHLREEAGWSLDLNELDESVSVRTRLVAVCNPNNPTGYILAEEEMDRIVAAAERAGAWILADEVYSGAERVAERPSVSFFGRYDRVLAVGSLSKAYGLPGLRIGWVVGPACAIDSIWARHEYTTISAAMLSNRLAAIALSPDVRPRLIRRTRDFIRKGFPVLRGWMAEHEEAFSLADPQAAAIAFVRYNLALNSTLLAKRLRQEQGVLVVPGDHFGMDHYLRISFGLPQDYLIAALDRVHDFVVGLES
jgi:aspartate/methionine/tyrosine aminotransferase